MFYALAVSPWWTLKPKRGNARNRGRIYRTPYVWNSLKVIKYSTVYTIYIYSTVYINIHYIFIYIIYIHYIYTYLISRKHGLLKAFPLHKTNPVCIKSTRWWFAEKLVELNTPNSSSVALERCSLSKWTKLRCFIQDSAFGGIGILF